MECHAEFISASNQVVIPNIPNREWGSSEIMDFDETSEMTLLKRVY